MLREFRFAARSLARWRWGSFAAIVTLAIGIATTTALYALVRLMVADFPGVPDVDRLARVYAASPALGVERSPVALNEYDSVLSKATTFTAIGAVAAEDAVIGTAPHARVGTAGYASSGFFHAMGVPPAAGRLFTAADVESSRPVVIVSTAFWRRELPDGVVGRSTVSVDGVARTVVGVMPPQFEYGFIGIGADVWIPLGPAGHNMPAIVTVFARLRDGIGWTAAQSELQALGKVREPWTWHAIPISDDARHRAVGVYAFAFGPAALVLLIACVNVACMLMARGYERDKELSVRRAMGATRVRVIRLLLIENTLLALVSGTIGCGLAMALLRVLGSALAAAQPALAGRVGADLSLLPIALGSSAIACVLFGATPALRLSKRDVAATLNGVPPTHRIQIAGYGARDVIVFAELACSVGLVVWTAMIFTLFGQVTGMRLNLPADRIVAMRVPERAMADTMLRVGAVPGVSHVTSSSGMLGGGGGRVGGGAIKVQTPDGRIARMSSLPVGPDFFEALALPILRGRAFDRTETHVASGVVVLSETAARQLAPDGNVVGWKLRITDHETTTAIVIGVSRDPIDYGAMARTGFVPGEMYVPYRPSVISNSGVILARTSADPHAVLDAIAEAARTQPGEPPARPVVFSEEWQHRFGNDAGMVVFRLLGGFALLTLLLAASGIFAVIGQSVTQRTREFGIRMALGARPGRVLAMVLVRELKLIAAAIGSGLVFTMGLTRALFVELTTLNAALPGLWIGALTLSGGVAAIAVAFATYRIVRLEPSQVLRAL
jgi:putative ABC transport system permease protein